MSTITQTSLIVSAIIYAALAIWRVRLRDTAYAPSAIWIAFSGMAIWSACRLSGWLPLLAFGEAVRTLGWLVYLARVGSFAPTTQNGRWIEALKVTLIGAAITRYVLILILLLQPLPVPRPILLLTVNAFDLAFAAAMLAYVNNVYVAVARSAGSGLRLILFIVGALWAYDLNIPTAILLNYRIDATLETVRSLLALLVAPLLALAARRKEHWRVNLSRSATFQSLTLTGVGFYFVGVSVVAGATHRLDHGFALSGQIVVATMVCVATFVLLLSDSARRRLKVFVSKHLFEHRYDYRTEWLRFSATINSAGHAVLPAEERAVRAIADVMEARSGFLYLRNDANRLSLAAQWGRGTMPRGGSLELTPDILHDAEVENRIFILDDPEETEAEHAVTEKLRVMLDIEDAWLAVPLVRMGRLTGLIILAHPFVERLLDWEDFDLLKVIGQQIAMFLTDAQSQAELEDARRFDEFNRRFAFIVHDIKNLVSQLALLSSNAELHGSNPRFQASMATTLQNSVQKMTTLLSRLSSENVGANAHIEAVTISSLIRHMAASKEGLMQMVVGGNESVVVHADPALLSLALDHLIQNAKEASEGDDPVVVTAGQTPTYGTIEVTDTGAGMSADFVRNRLFKPFVSTKQGGFGIGAGEAKALVEHMGGMLDVESVEGVGTTFRISLPLAGAATGSREA